MDTTHHLPTYAMRRPTSHMDGKLSACNFIRPRPQINKYGRLAGAKNAAL
jgi:hypothetical protein